MARTKPQAPRGMMVHRIHSPKGQVELARRGLTTRDLETAIAAYQKAEKVRVATPIGVNEHGFFGSTREGWRPDQLDAFTEPLVIVPWVQLLELLGRVPEGTMGEFLKGGGDEQ